MINPVVIVERKLFEDLFALAVKHDFEAAPVVEAAGILHDKKPNPAHVHIFVDNTAGQIHAVHAASSIAHQITVVEVAADKLYDRSEEVRLLFSCPGSYEGATMRLKTTHRAQPSDEIMSTISALSEMADFAKI